MTGDFPNFLTMVVIDLAMIAIAISASVLLVVFQQLLRDASAVFGAILLAGGLCVLASLYVVDLYTMLLLPDLIGMEQSMTFMTKLHTSYAWYINSTAGVLLISGLAAILFKLKQFHKLAEEKRAEAEYKELRLRTIFMSEPECVKTVDLAGRLLDMNPAGLRMVESDGVDEIRGKHVTELIAPEYRSEFRDGIASVFRGNRVQQRFEIIGLNGARRWVDQIAVPIFDAESGTHVVEMLAVTRDISAQMSMVHELKKEKGKAEAASKAKSEFLANMSHEIRTPLNGVLGMAQILTKKDLNDEQRDYVSTIIDSGSTLLSVVNDVLDLSKIEVGKISITPVQSRVAAFLERSVALWKPKADEKGLALTLEIGKSVPETLLLDEVRVRQCISNLISNGIKFTNSGTISVRVDCAMTPGTDDAKLTLTVADTGVGIALEDQCRLFQPFEQGDASMARRFDGAGLGLAITRKLANQMGGDLTVESSRGNGSTFTLTLTARQTQEDVRQQNAESIRADHLSFLSEKRVLVVDDNETNRTVARVLLAEFFAAIEEAANGQEALELIQQKKNFDLIYLDMHMPVLDGPGMLNELRSGGVEAWRATSVIALTADAMYGDRDKYLAMGMDGYVSKPIDQSAILAETLRVLGVFPKDQDLDRPRRKAS